MPKTRMQGRANESIVFQMGKEQENIIYTSISISACVMVYAEPSVRV